MQIKHIFGSALVAASLTAAALPAGAETLKFAHWVTPQHTLTASTIEPLIAATKDSGLEIDVYPGGELGAGPLEQYVRVVQGVADMVWGLPGYTSSQFQRTMISELPGAKPAEKTGYDMLWDAWDAGLLASEFPATVPVALWLSEPNIFIMKDKVIRTPEDVKGLKLRVSGSAAAAVIESLGATPVQMPAGEMYNALQTGLIDGVVTGASAVGDFKLNEVANSYTVGAPLGRISFYVVLNAAKYNGLPAEQKAALDAIMGRPLSKSAEDGWNAAADRIIAELEADSGKTVVTLNSDEAAAFGELTIPVTQQIVGELGAQDVLDVMQGN